ncbi:MAG: hypothetical protein PHU08_02050 [Dehalococcoidales bacterium]|nr:hypothetical protein [Dehalococcoidales bacterium]
MKRERGQALILVLILLAVGTFLTIPFIQQVFTTTKSRQAFGQAINNDYAAEAAIEYGTWRLNYEDGFAASLPVGVESEPFYITLNGVTASGTVTASTTTGELSGQELAGRAGDDIFKVTKTVTATSVYQTIAADGFESHSSSGGTGAWLGSWTLSGDYYFSTEGEHEGSYHLRLRGDDNLVPGDGRAQRQVNLSTSTGAGPFLYFWARVESFESGDTAQLKVSTNGVNWTVLKTFDYYDSDSQYHLYEYDLSSYGTPASFYLAFETNLSSYYDYLYIDAISFSNTVDATVIEPGVSTIYTYYVTIQCLDPDGGYLDRLTDILPNRLATSGDYLQYIPGSTYWDSLTYDSYAFDGFESASSSGGTGSWVGNWALSGDYSFNTDGEYAGNYHLRLRSTTGYAQRQADVSTHTGAGPFLYFWARLSSFETGDTAVVKASTNGIDWQVLQTFTDGDDDNIYHRYSFDLSSGESPSVLYVAFDANMSSTEDYFYIDNVEFSSSQEATAEWPVPPFDPTSITDTGSYSTRHEELVWDFEDAGYGDVEFAYGEIKTLTFRAQAALTTGVYCNEIRASVSSWDWYTDIVSGKTAKITVGNSTANCAGGLLTVTKSADPLIIYPNEETTVTYAITIENVDTVAIPIYHIEDWLPSTGSADPAAAFTYVDNSAYGYIFGRSYLPVLFYDDFNRPASYTVSYWTDSDNSSSNAQLINNEYSSYVRLRNYASITQSSISTAYNIGIVLSYRYERGDTAGGLLKAEWKPSSSGTWNTLAQHSLTTSWQTATWNLPSTADDTQIDIRFTGIATGYYQDARVDTVKVSCVNPVNATPVCMPDDNEGTDFFYETWQSDPLYQRWELNWNFDYYPGASDPVWGIGGVCAGKPYADYDPYLLLQPGEIFEVVFQATVTLSASGSYYNEVFVKINEDDDEEYDDDEWLYSWPVAGVTVPQYDLQAETLSSILRAAAKLSSDGRWDRIWHWWKH